MSPTAAFAETLSSTSDSAPDDISYIAESENTASTASETSSLPASTDSNLPHADENTPTPSAPSSETGEDPVDVSNCTPDDLVSAPEADPAEIEEIEEALSDYIAATESTDTTSTSTSNLSLSEQQSRALSRGDAVMPLGLDPLADSTDANASSRKSASAVSSVSIEWIETPDSVVNGSKLEVSPKNDDPFMIRARVRAQVSSSDVLEIGSVSLSIPKNIVQDRTGSPTGKMTFAVPPSPDDRATFAYTELQDRYVLTNTRPLSASSSMMFEFSIRNLVPHTLNGGGSSAYETAPWTVDLSVTAPDGSTSDSEASSPLRASFSTSEYISYAYTRHQMTSSVWRSDFPADLRPANPDDYIYMDFYSWGTPVGNQAYDLQIDSAAAVSGTASGSAAPEVLGYKTQFGEVHKGSSAVIGQGMWSTSSYQTWYTHTYVAIPKSSVPDGHEYNVSLQTTFTLSGVDSSSSTSKSSNASKAYRPLSFTSAGGHFGLGVYGGNRYPLAVNSIENGNDQEASYSVSSVAFGYPYTFVDKNGDGQKTQDEMNQKSYTLDTRLLSAAIDGLPATTDDICISAVKLGTPKFYEWAQFSTDGFGYPIDPSDGSQQMTAGESGYREKSKGTAQIVLYAASRPAECGIGTVLASFQWENGNLSSRALRNGVSVDGTVAYLPDGIGDVIARLETKEAGVVYSANPIYKVSSTENMRQNALSTFQNEESPSWNMKLVGGIYTDTLATGTPLVSDYGTDYLDGAAIAVSPSLSRTVDNDTVNRTARISFVAKVDEQTNISSKSDLEEARELGYIANDEKAVWRVLLPEGAALDLDSISLRDGDAATSVRLLRNWEHNGISSNRDLLVVEADLYPEYTYRDALGRYGYGDAPELHFDAYYSWEDRLDYGDAAECIFAYESFSPSFGTIEGYRGEPDTPTGGNNNTSDAVSASLASKELSGLLDGLSDNEDTSFVYARTSDTLGIDVTAVAGFSKKASGDNGVSWHGDSDRASAIEGGRYTYRIRYSNDGSESTGEPVSNIVFYDNLDNGGKGTDTKWRGTFCGVDLRQAIHAGAAPKVYYSTRDVKATQVQNRNLSDTSIWTDTCPEDKSSIRSIAIDLSEREDGSSFTLGTGESVSVDIVMRAPQASKVKPSDPDSVYMDKDSAVYAKNTAYITSSVSGDDGTPSESSTQTGLLPFSISGTLSVSDDRDRDGHRPWAVVLHLLANGVDTGETVDIVLPQQNEAGNAPDDPVPFSFSTDGLWATDENGDDIYYSVFAKEKLYNSEDDLYGYETRSSVERSSGHQDIWAVLFHDPERISITGTKSWIGDDDFPVSRPNSITVNAYKTPEIMDVSVDNETSMDTPAKSTRAYSPDWTYEIDGLYRYDRIGKPLVYVVSEDYVPGYIAHIHGTNIVNEYYPYGNLEIANRVAKKTPDIAMDHSATYLISVEKNGEPVSDEWKYKRSNGETGTISNGGKIDIPFGESIVIYDVPSETVWRIEQELPSGWSSEENEKTGGIRAGETSEAVFDNTYSSFARWYPKVQKVLNGRELENRQFSFELMEFEDGQYYNEIYDTYRTAHNSLSGAVNFPGFKMTEDNDGEEHFYMIGEDNLGASGYEYDDALWKVAVSVRDNGDGTMTLEDKYFKDDNPDDIQEQAVFENSYQADGKVDLAAWVTVDGLDLTEDMFTVELDDETGKALQTKSNDENGKITFDSIEYTEKDAGKTYRYTAKELDNDPITGVIYDKRTYTFTVVVHDPGTGKLEFDTDFSCSDGEYHDAPVFENKTQPGSLTVSKGVELQGGATAAADIAAAKESEHRFRITMSGEDIEDGDWKFEKKEYKDGVYVKEEVAIAVWYEDEAALRFYKMDKKDAPTKGEAYNVTGVVIGYDVEKVKTTWGTSTLPWKDILSNVKNVEFCDEITPISTAWWFSGANNLKTVSGILNTSKVTDMSHMFYSCSSLISVNVSDWDTSRVASMDSMFANCSSLTALAINNWNTSNVTTMSSMFKVCRSLSSLDLSKWDTSKVQDMSDMFSGNIATSMSLSSINVSNWNTSKVTDMSGIFAYCSSLSSLDLSKWDTSKVQDMSDMFNYCSSLNVLKLSNWNTQNVTNMKNMFTYCSSITSLDLSKWNTSKVQNMEFLFNFCSKLSSLNVSSWQTSSVTSMRTMFQSCSSITSLDLSNWDTSKVTIMNNMFAQCTNIQKIYVSNKWSTASCTTSSSMFYSCSRLSGALGTSYASAQVKDASYARIDASGKPGYFTYKAAPVQTASVMSLSNDNDNNVPLYDKSNTISSPIDFVSGTDNNNTDDTSSSSSKSDLSTPQIGLFGVEIPPASAEENISSSEYIVGYQQQGDGMASIASGIVDERLLGIIYDNKIKNLPALASNDIARTIIQEKNSTARIQNVNTIMGNNNISTFSSESTSDTNILYSGTVGGCSWTIDDLGELRIFPTNGVSGIMSNPNMYSSSYWTWLNYNSIIKTAVISSGVIVQRAQRMFFQCNSLESLDVSGWDTKSVTDMTSMFCYCDSLKSLDVGGWDTSNVTVMSFMFNSCDSLESLDVSGWDTSNVTSMSSMFSGCYSLESLDLSGWDTSNVTSMYTMFYYCESLSSLDLSGWDTSNVADMNSMFYGCSKLSFITISDKFSLNSCYSLPSLPSPQEDYASYPLDPSLKWVSDDAPTGGPYTAAQLLAAIKDDPASAAGTWRWMEKDISYTINFSSGSLPSTSTSPDSSIIGNLPSQRANPSESYTVPRSPYYAYGYKMTGWRNKSTGDIYTPGQVLENGLSSTEGAIINLEAIWEEGSGAYMENNVLEFTLHGGESITFPEVPSGVSYKIEELTQSGWRLVSSTGDIEGKITPLSSKSAVFTNTPDSSITAEDLSAEIIGTKSMDGVLAAGFHFGLYDESDNKIDEAVSDENGLFSFTRNIETDSEGNNIISNYIVREIPDSTRTDISYDDKSVSVSVFAADGYAVAVPDQSLDFQNKTAPAKLTLDQRYTHGGDPDYKFDYLVENGSTQKIVSVIGEDSVELEVDTKYPVSITPQNFPDWYVPNSADDLINIGTLSPGQEETVISDISYRNLGKAYITVHKNLIDGKLYGNDFVFGRYAIKTSIWTDRTVNDKDGVALIPVNYYSYDPDYKGTAEDDIDICEYYSYSPIWVDRVVMDKTIHTVHITWQDNGDGTVTPTIEYPDGSDHLTFTNTVITSNVVIRKDSPGSTPASEDTEFTYKVIITDPYEDEENKDPDNPPKYTVTYPDGSEEEITSGDTIHIKEGDENKIIINKVPSDFRVEIVPDGDIPDGYDDTPENRGDETVPRDGSDVDIVLTSTYRASGLISLGAAKVARGFELQENQFLFEARDVETGEVAQARNDADGKVEFLFGSVDESDYGKIRTYDVYEIIDGGDYVYDDIHARVMVEFTDDGKGNMIVAYSHWFYTDSNGEILLGILPRAALPLSDSPTSSIADALYKDHYNFIFTEASDIPVFANYENAKIELPFTGGIGILALTGIAFIMMGLGVGCISLWRKQSQVLVIQNRKDDNKNSRV